MLQMLNGCRRFSQFRCVATGLPLRETQHDWDSGPPARRHYILLSMLAEIFCDKEINSSFSCSKSPFDVILSISVQTAVDLATSSRPTSVSFTNVTQLIQEHPDARQYDYAKWLGVSQGRVSQLKKLL
ncbi:hypothetical protein [Paenibacillus sp. IHB B 3084]|uniref:hypothetical protein n=1 Tax=Paenibacillus sp. IHB B 3084 TaxID=867076 RepID=UPI001CB94D0A|nr:hypothetical protein [Paenibacillus sp. IHB B 3084]